MFRLCDIHSRGSIMSLVAVQVDLHLVINEKEESV